MAFGVTQEGFKAKRFDDLYSEVGGTLKTDLNLELDKTPDSVISALTNTILLPLSQAWANSQEQQTMFDVNSASGKHLDDIVSWVGIRRQQGSKASGNIYVTTKSQVTLPANTEFADESGNIFTNDATISCILSSCVENTLGLSTDITIQGRPLQLYVNGESYHETVTANTKEAVLSALTALVNKINSAVATVTLSFQEVGNEWVITCKSKNDTEKFNMQFFESFSIKTVTSFGKVYFEEYGDKTFPENSITVPPSFGAITAVTNRYVITGGNAQESDQDLRARHAISRFKSGSATVNAIRASLLEVSGVASAVVVENDTSVHDSINDVPPQHLRCILKGGEDADIANAIYNSKAAGIGLVGDTTVNVQNSQGDTVPVTFSRPKNQYVYVQIQYIVNSEEIFPADGEEQIRTLIEEYGNSLDTGQDVIPQRLSAVIYSNVTGIEKLLVTAAVTDSASIAPTVYTSNKIPISNTQESIFDVSRIDVSEQGG